METLILNGTLPLQAENAGLFVSTGRGRHPERVIGNYELIFVRGGTLGLREDEREFQVQAGETLLLWPGRTHGGTLDYPADLSFYWVHFRLCDHPAIGAELALLPQHTKLTRPERMTDCFRRFLDDQESGRLTSATAALLVLQMLLETIAPPEPARTEHALAARAHDHIAANFAKGLHAGDVARELRLNPDYLGRVFRLAYGRTLSQVIHEHQLREARHFLRETGANLEEIALACGFSEPRYFRKLFTQAQGMSPREYRRLYARVHVNTR